MTKFCALLNRGPTSTQLHPPLPSSIYFDSAPPSPIYLHPAHFNLLPAPCKTLDVIRTNIICNWTIFQNLGRNTQSCPLELNWQSWHLEDVSSESGLKFLKFRSQNSFLGKFGPKKLKNVLFDWKLAHTVSRGCWFLFRN